MFSAAPPSYNLSQKLPQETPIKTILKVYVKNDKVKVKISEDIKQLLTKAT